MNGAIEHPIMAKTYKLGTVRVSNLIGIYFLA